MFIEIHELEQHPIDFEEEIAPDVLDLGEDLQQVGPVAVPQDEHNWSRSSTASIR